MNISENHFSSHHKINKNSCPPIKILGRNQAEMMMNRTSFHFGPANNNAAAGFNTNKNALRESMQSSEQIFGISTTGGDT